MDLLSSRPIPAGKKILLLDVDGTLVDSYPGIRAGLLHALDELDVEHPAEEFLQRIAGPPMEETLRSLSLDETQVKEGFDAYMDYTRNGGWAQATAFEGVDKLLSDLHLDYYLATATSKGREFASMILQKLDLYRYLDFLGAAEEYGARRNKPAVINYVLESLDIRERADEILMIGDRIHDVEGAREYGIATVAVTWGYGSPEEWDEAETQARNPEELQEIIHEWSTQ